ncbi:MAG TPA: hypothetical protein VK612_11520 [Pyrinomonadaceae bacterium]|nr:hypothetical protein [Pyrinomonadaceae bacterium]
MKIILRVVQVAFGIPWLVFGVQHFMYADFVAGLVPAYLPFRLFLAYFTGTAMLAAGISLITNIKAHLAPFWLGVMMLSFILLIHVPKISGEPSSLMTWTRALQDVAIALVAFMLAAELSKDKLASFARYASYVFAALLVVFGIHQFLDLDFLVTKTAPYLPLRIFGFMRPEPR